VVPFKSLLAVSYSYFMVTMVLSCIISEIMGYIGLKSRFFRTPSAFDALLMGVPVGVLPCHWYGKTRMV